MLLAAVNGDRHGGHLQPLLDATSAERHGSSLLNSIGNSDGLRIISRGPKSANGGSVLGLAVIQQGIRQSTTASPGHQSPSSRTTASPITLRRDTGEWRGARSPSRKGWPPPLSRRQVPEPDGHDYRFELSPDPGYLLMMSDFISRSGGPGFVERSMRSRLLSSSVPHRFRVSQINPNAVEYGANRLALETRARSVLSHSQNALHSFMSKTPPSTAMPRPRVIGATRGGGGEGGKPMAMTMSGRPVKMSEESGYGFALGAKVTNLPGLQRDGWYSSDARRQEQTNIKAGLLQTRTHGMMGGDAPGRTSTEGRGLMPSATYVQSGVSGVPSLKIEWCASRPVKNGFMPPTTALGVSL